MFNAASSRLLYRSIWTIWATLALCFPPDCWTQSRGLPIYARTVVHGISGALDLGFDTLGFRTTALTVTGAFGHCPFEKSEVCPLLDVSASVGRIAGDSLTSGWSFGGTVLIVNAVQVAFDHSTYHESSWLHVPLSGVLPIFACLTPKLYFALPAHVTWNFDRGGTPSHWESSWGSAGLNADFELRNGLGFQLGFVGPFKDAMTANPYRQAAAGVGIRFTPHSIPKSATPADAKGCHFLLF